MSLEIRIETLEHELKILKNEIENTLLEIQNQVLIHYYPSLRAENSAPPKELATLLATSPHDRGEVEKEKRNGNHSSINDDEATNIINPPKTKEVSLSEIGSKPKHPPPPPAGDDRRPTAKAHRRWSETPSGPRLPHRPPSPIWPNG
jgi:hypothetical protein